MGNVYNVEQISVPPQSKSGMDASKVGLDQWKTEVRKQVMEKLKGYAPKQAEMIIKNTFGDMFF